MPKPNEGFDHLDNTTLDETRGTESIRFPTGGRAMSDDTSDLEARVSAPGAQESATRAQLKPQTTNMSPDTEDEDGDISFPAGGPGP